MCAPKHISSDIRSAKQLSLGQGVSLCENVGHMLTSTAAMKENTCHTQQVASLLPTELSMHTTKFMNVQIQYGSSVCGLFAVAFAMASLCKGFDLTICIYRQPNMRRHFLACIKNGEMKVFPTARICQPIYTKPAKIEDLTVHVQSCRMVFNEREAGSEKMIMC